MRRLIVSPKVDQNLQLDLFTDSTVVTELLERHYKEQGYLVAAIDAPPAPTPSFTKPFANACRPGLLDSPR